MKFTLSWLKEHLDTSASLDAITEALTRIGLEVEGVEAKAARAKAEELLRSAPRVPQIDMIRSIRAMSARRQADLVAALEGLAKALGAAGVAPRMLFEDEPARARRRG